MPNPIVHTRDAPTSNSAPSPPFPKTNTMLLLVYQMLIIPFPPTYAKKDEEESAAGARGGVSPCSRRPSRNA